MPTTSEFFFFWDFFLQLDIFSSCFIYPSHEFCYKFSDQLLWLRDMTSWLVGAVKPFLSKSVYFSSFFRLQNSRFFLKTSKEIGKAWRKSLTRANRASLSLVPHLLFDCSHVLEYAKIRTVLQSNLSSTIKVKLVDKIKQSDNLSVILHVKHTELTIILVFSWFLILSKRYQDIKIVRYQNWVKVITFPT